MENKGFAIFAFFVLVLKTGQNMAATNPPCGLISNVQPCGSPCSCDSSKAITSCTLINDNSSNTQMLLSICALDAEMFSRNFYIENLDDVSISVASAGGVSYAAIYFELTQMRELKGFNNFVNYLENSLTKLLQFSLNSVQFLETTDMESVLSQSASVLTSLKIVNSFDQSDKYAELNIEKIQLPLLSRVLFQDNPYLKVRLSQMQYASDTALIFSQAMAATDQQLFQFKDTQCSGKYWSYIFNSNASSITFAWKPSVVDDQSYFMPTFFRMGSDTSCKTQLILEPSGSAPEILQKEVLMYVNYLDLFAIPDTVQRIEFGTLSTSTTFVASKLVQSGGVRLSKEIEFEPYKNFWFSGNCAKLPTDNDYFFCQICYMHQFGLHRTKDNVLQMCQNQVVLATKPLRCHWGPIKPPPSYVTLDVLDPITETNLEPYCLPDDLQTYTTKSQSNLLLATTPSATDNQQADLLSSRIQDQSELKEQHKNGVEVSVVSIANEPEIRLHILDIFIICYLLSIITDLSHWFDLH